MAYSEKDTDEWQPVAEAADSIVVDLIESQDIEIAAATHRGVVRSNNEDQFAVVRRTRKGEVLASSLAAERLDQASEQHSWLLVVADGVGGNVSGEVASATAMQAILNLGPQLSSWIMHPADDVQENDQDRVDRYAKAIQQQLRQLAEADPELKGMATTITAAYIFGSEAIVVNVGDSRSYLLRDNSIQQITEDHTLARELEDAGIPRESLRRYQHVLTRCFNTRSESITFDVFRLALHPNDRILLCSDGLSDMLSDETINRIVAPDSTVKDACEQLVTAALNNGGRDNVTVVLAHV
jgi:protein phosphatase